MTDRKYTVIQILLTNQCKFNMNIDQLQQPNQTVLRGKLVKISTCCELATTGITVRNKLQGHYFSKPISSSFLCPTVANILPFIYKRVLNINKCNILLSFTPCDDVKYISSCPAQNLAVETNPVLYPLTSLTKDYK